MDMYHRRRRGRDGRDCRREAEGGGGLEAEAMGIRCCVERAGEGIRREGRHGRREVTLRRGGNADVDVHFGEGH